MLNHSFSNWIMYSKDLIHIGPLAFKPLVFYLTIILLLILLTILLLVYKTNQKKDHKSHQQRTPEKTKEVISKTKEVIQNGDSRYKVGKLHNIGKRSNQQDSFAVSDESDPILCNNKGLIAIVADGMGGLSDGDKVSSIVTLSFFRYFHEKDTTSPSEALLSMLREANEEVNNYLGDKITQAGSTLVSGIIKDNKLYWISVGDSHIYHYRNGSLIRLNREHTYSHELDTKAANGEISREAALNDPQRDALTSYIGMGRLEQIDRNHTPLELYSGDRVIFMSDGVFGTIGDMAIETIMKYPIDESIQKLDEAIKTANKRNQDNYTAVIIQCE